jgi:hypothetical protein
MARKRARRSKLRPWSLADVRELRAHSRSKSPIKKIAKAMKRTAGVRRHCAVLSTAHLRKFCVQSGAVIEPVFAALASATVDR